MKKFLITILIISTAATLAACRVGPKEEPPGSVVTEDAAQTFPEETLEPETTPITTAPPETTAPETIPSETEPVPEISEDEEPVEEEESEPIRQNADFDEIEPIELIADISLNVRRGPSTDYESFGSIAEGSRVTAVGESRGWYVIVHKGEYGFVSGRYLSEAGEEGEDEEE